MKLRSSRTYAWKQCACQEVSLRGRKLFHGSPLPPLQLLGRPSTLFFDPKCKLCTLLALTGRIERRAALGDDQKLYLLAFHTSSLYSTVGISFSDGLPPPERSQTPETVSYACLDESEYNLSQRTPPYHVRVVKDSGCITPVGPRRGGTKAFHARVLGPYFDSDVVKGWLSFCRAHHFLTCQHGKEEASSGMPLLRVIDCSTRDLVKIEPPTEYLALSYVWGGSEMDQSSDALQSFEKLPKSVAAVVEDAALVTLRIGFRYLWVDKYCIEQANPQEKHHQIRNMDSVYRRAVLTIVAGAGNDASFGLPGVANRARDSPAVTKVGKTTFSFIPPQPAARILKSKWHQRGWTYQECYLSQRLLVFDNQDVYFECRAMNCEESMSTSLELVHISTRTRLSDCYRRGAFQLGALESLDFRDIYDQLRLFTMRHLTYASDVLDAVQGMLNFFETTCRCRPLIHFWGIPVAPYHYGEWDLKRSEKWSNEQTCCNSTRKEQLLRALCWTLEAPATRRPGFPSWSWSGWDGVLEAWPAVDPWADPSDFDVFCESKSSPNEQVTWEVFCKKSHAQKEQFDPSHRLFVTATLFRLNLFQARLKSSWWKADEDLVMWHASFDMPKQLFFNNRVMWTKHFQDDGGDDFYEKLRSGPMHGLLVSNNPVTQPVSDGPNAPYLMRILLLDDTGEGWERVGMVDFKFAPLHLPQHLASLTFTDDGHVLTETAATPEVFHEIPSWRETICLV